MWKLQQKTPYSLFLADLLQSICVSDAFFRALPHSTPSPMETPGPARLAPPPVMCPLRGADSSSFTASLRELERVRGNVNINCSDMIVVSLGILLYLWPSERWLCLLWLSSWIYGFYVFIFSYKQLFNNVGRSLCVVCVCSVAGIGGQWTGRMLKWSWEGSQMARFWWGTVQIRDTSSASAFARRESRTTRAWSTTEVKTHVH